MGHVITQAPPTRPEHTHLRPFEAVSPHFSPVHQVSARGSKLVQKIQKPSRSSGQQTSDHS